jgi:hypothetical protein
VGTFAFPGGYNSRDVGDWSHWQKVDVPQPHGFRLNISYVTQVRVRYRTIIEDFGGGYVLTIHQAEMQQLRSTCIAFVCFDHWGEDSGVYETSFTLCSPGGSKKYVSGGSGALRLWSDDSVDALRRWVREMRGYQDSVKPPPARPPAYHYTNGTF